MLTLFLESLPCPFGPPFAVATDARGAVVATAFGGEAELRQRLALAGDFSLQTPAVPTAARRQVEAYFAGQRHGFELELAPRRGTAFQQKVWHALGQIPFGQTTSYAALAAQLSRPRAARAVGAANAANPICLIVPCHRVIAADGSLGGFAYGLALKAALLAHERAPR